VRGVAGERKTEDLRLKTEGKNDEKIEDRRQKIESESQSIRVSEWDEEARSREARGKERLHGGSTVEKLRS